MIKTVLSVYPQNFKQMLQDIKKIRKQSLLRLFIIKTLHFCQHHLWKTLNHLTRV